MKQERKMNQANINTKSRILGAVLALFAAAFAPAIALAHGGEEHVTGTVAKISDASVTVKTAAGKSVEVGFDAKTTYTRAKKTIAKTDIKVGDKIVIHAVEVNEKLTAKTVEIGSATPAKTAPKS